MFSPPKESILEAFQNGLMHTQVDSLPVPPPSPPTHPTPPTHIHQTPDAFNYYIPYINKTSVRSAIHVGNLSYSSQSDMVEKALVNVSMFR